MPARNDTASAAGFILIPLVGIALFLLLFFWATYLYPGGWQADKQAVGFSWMHNYWCNLLNERAMNGEQNPARPVALAAMLILCGSLSVFWYYLPLLFLHTNQRADLLLQITGICSMFSAAFIVTAYHDIVIMIASLFGFFALAGTFVGLYRCRLVNLFWFGCSCLLLMAVNNYIYYTKDLLYYLPVIQKVTFVAVLFRIVWMIKAMYARQQAN
ncbi:hypothetical protein [Fibrella forsythiae]|uniref:DUF998 domain-containing protein n=1 Tax=Fibrella forsythiae TaxID=2817061 RepID=A0ABS3JJ78_9BACT|nr:hypothetical protein [Fibrella forsythiae]MBO0948932.1 hypothetical protein [Fibrella forsythiae]